MERRQKRIQRIKDKITELEGRIDSGKGKKGKGKSQKSLLELVGGKGKKSEKSFKSLNSGLSFKTKKKNMSKGINDTNKFYEQAKEKQKMAVVMEKEVVKGYKKLANKRKMSDNSVFLLSERLDTNIAIAILNSDEKLTKRLRFGQVGKILFDLQLFNVIVFKEDFEGKLNSCKDNPN